MLLGIGVTSAVVNSQLPPKAAWGVSIASLGLSWWMIRNDLNALSTVASAVGAGATFAAASSGCYCDQSKAIPAKTR